MTTKNEKMTKRDKYMILSGLGIFILSFIISFYNIWIVKDQTQGIIAMLIGLSGMELIWIQNLQEKIYVGEGK